MENIVINETKSTPEVNFDFKNNVLSLKGQSYPEDPLKFYSPLIETVKKYLSSVNTRVTLNLKLVYLNTSSLKCIMILFDIFEEAFIEKKDIVINWYYDKENDMTLESGEDFKEDMTVPFNIVEE